MTVYVLRYNNLVKIGFSSDFAQRVRKIMGQIPGDVEFVGHMPGDEAVEQHLHAMFDAYRFSGEWFVESDDIREFCRLVLHKHLPEQIDHRAAPLRKKKPWSKWTLVVRRASVLRWPEQSGAQRRKNLAALLGWSPARVKGLYFSERMVGLSAEELDDLRVKFGADQFDEAVSAVGNSETTGD